MRLAVIGILGLAVSLVVATTPAQADDEAQCRRFAETAAIAACDRLIAAGKGDAKTQSVWHSSRCAARNVRGDAKAALADCDEAIRRDAANAGAHNNRCWVRNGLGDFDKAIEDCTRAITLDPKYARAHGNRCASHGRRNEPGKALLDCNEAIRLDPQSPHALETRCWIHNLLNERDKAIEDCTRSITLSPKFNRPYVGRCSALLAKGELDRAQLDCNEAIRLDPHWAPAFNTRCALRNKRRELDSAIADCTQALRLDPKHHFAYLHRCEARGLKNEPKSAAADCTEWLKLEPRSVSGLSMRCWIYTLKREPDAAIRDCDESLRLNSRHVNAYINRGNAYRQKGDTERAIADYTQAINLDPRHHLPLIGRGLVYEGQGKLDAALVDFRALLQIDKDKDAARARVARVENAIADLAAAAARPRRVALVIGNGAYQKVAHLNNARNDAEAVAAAFRKLDFTTVQIRHDLPREQFVDALKTFAEQTTGAEWAVLYYAGHGIEVNGTNYVVPTNATLASDRQVPFEAIPLEQILLSVEGASRLRLVMLDACRDNPFLARMKRTGATRSVGRGLAPVEPDSATLVVYAAKAGAVAQDGNGRHGPFAEAFVKHVDTPGLEINLLFRKVRDEVMRATARRQEPYVYGSLSAEELFFRAK